MLPYHSPVSPTRDFTRDYGVEVFFPLMMAIWITNTNSEKCIQEREGGRKGENMFSSILFITIIFSPYIFIQLISWTISNPIRQHFSSFSFALQAQYITPHFIFTHIISVCFRDHADVHNSISSLFKSTRTPCGLNQGSRV